MDTIEIVKLAAADPYVRRHFLGVFALDEIPQNISKKPACLIVNTDESDKAGTHWIAFYFDEQNNGEFFDSYGRRPLKNFEQFLKENSKSYKWNKIRIQGILSSACGQHCLYYLMKRCRGESMTKIIGNFEENNFEFNDQFVVKVINSVFNTNTKLMDIDLIVQSLLGSSRQSCKCENDCRFCF